MSWFRRLLGREAGDEGDAPRETEEPARLHEEGAGPVYGLADVPFPEAKARLLELLRERGAKSAVIGYDGGNDEGWLTELTYFPKPFMGSPEDWQLPTGGTSVDTEKAYEEWESPDGRLVEAASAVVSDKWGGFAGEFHVDGRLFVSVPSGEIVREDAISIEEGPVDHEIEVI